MKQVRIAVIGGGAAGMMAAITAAKNGAEVTLLEATNRIGNKILLTGNGKCNFSNLFLDESCYYCKDKAYLQKVWKQFSANDILQFFNEAGMLVKNKSGYLYPAGEQASIVLDILRLELKKNAVRIITEAKVIKIVKNMDAYCVDTEEGKQYFFDKVIITTGGRSYPKTGSDGNGYKLAKKLGHSIIPTVPALVQLCGCDDFYKIIAGVRSEGSVSVYVDNKQIRTERGEIQFTDYGISGIPVFQLSRIVSYGLFEKKRVKVVADVLPDFNESQLKEHIKERILIHRENTLEDFMCGLSNKKLCQLAIRQAGKKACDCIEDMSFEDVSEVVFKLKNIPFHIVDTKGYNTAQVTAGGVAVEELDEKMQSKIAKGVYFAGEIVDIDGICGGYNLQWAFASGYIAGCNAANGKG